MEVQVHLLDGTAGWGPMDFGTLAKARKLGYPAPDYFAVYAVEGGQVLSMVRVLRLPFTTPEGTEAVGAIQGVVTRRDQSRRGLARALLADVSTRENASGSRCLLLWTGRGQVSHRLYESLGYQDIYTPELAVKMCSPTKRPKGYILRKAKESETVELEELHREATAGRLGFTPRPAGVVQSLIKLGFRDQNDFSVLLRDGEMVAYTILQAGPIRSRVDELVVKDGVPSESVLGTIESAVGGSWLSIRNTSVRDHLHALGKRGYSFSQFTYYALMAQSLEPGRPATPEALGTTDESFTCQQLDYF
jgi:GNAT superfamily N-acetyltransferase